MSNLVLLCPAHHRLVHEGGFSIARGDAGGFEVRRPDGVVVPSVPACEPSASAHELRLVIGARLVSAGTSIDDETLLPRWNGRSPDMSACVAAGLPREAPPSSAHFAVPRGPRLAVQSFRDPL